MSVDADAVSEPGWEVDPDDEWGVAVITTVGRQLKLRREAVGMRAADFAKATGYSEDMIYKIESGQRIPRPEFLDKADDVLGAGGLLAAMKHDVEKVRYPRKARDLAALEAKAVELLSYGNHHVHGLLQTEEFMEALMGSQRPKLPPDRLKEAVAGRLARKKIFERSPAPELSFVLEEVTLRRPIGGRPVLRRQLQHLLDIAQLPNVQIQVMPTDRWDHPGMGGRIQVLKFEDGTAVARMDDGYGGRPVSDPKQLRIVELRYGSIRAEALNPKESVAFIGQLLGGT